MDIDSGLFVQQGDSWQPETASRHNAVNEMLGFLGSSGGDSCEQLRTESPETIRGQNGSKTTIPAGSCVTLYPPDLSQKRLFADTFVIKPGVADPCGITLSDCPPGETVDVQISGLVTVQRSTPLPPDVMIIPGYPFYNKTLVNINCPGNDLYRNYFKVSAVEFNEEGRISKVRIYDGGNPSSSYAGITDIGDVSTGELEYNFTTGTNIYMRLKVNEAGGYLTHEFEINSSPQHREPYILLAEIGPNGSVIQRWTGGQIFWRERFVIPFGRRQ
jgi:hypothetical protein